MTPRSRPLSCSKLCSGYRKWGRFLVARQQSSTTSWRYTEPCRSAQSSGAGNSVEAHSNTVCRTQGQTCHWAAGPVPNPTCLSTGPALPYFHCPSLTPQVPSHICPPLKLPSPSLSLSPLGFSSHPVLNLSLDFRTPSGLSEDSLLHPMGFLHAPPLSSSSADQRAHCRHYAPLLPSPPSPSLDTFPYPITQLQTAFLCPQTLFLLQLLSVYLGTRILCVSDTSDHWKLDPHLGRGLRKQ